MYCSPKPFNITPLQVEILEKELGDLKLQLQETESRNLYLSAIVDEQKKYVFKKIFFKSEILIWTTNTIALVSLAECSCMKNLCCVDICFINQRTIEFFRKLERYERDREKERERAMQPDPELLRKLDDAEAIIRRLRRENSDLRRENATHYQPRDPTHNPQQQQRENGYNSPRNQGRGNSRHRGNNGGHYRTNWFPPLHSQSFWNGERNPLPVDGQNVLPNLPPAETPNGPQYQGRRGANNNHYHNGDGGRKYRGGRKDHKPT